MRARDWRPSASLEALRERARIARLVRDFFHARGVLEVSTPLLGCATATDPHIHSIEALVHYAGRAERRYLQTSPELAMKRLLAAGAGAIYQLGPAFRDRERGAWHSPEFTLLEWYRPGFDLERLMAETDALLARVLGRGAGRRIGYRQAFLELGAIDPFTVETAALEEAAAAHGLSAAPGLPRDALLDLLFTHRVQPRLGAGVVHVHDYPASQAAMARVVPGAPPLARRVEVFVDGVELANGYEELTDASEQRARFEADLAAREAGAGAATPPLDERLLAALEHGMPAASGIALGFDRLVMLALGLRHIDQVVPFPFEHA